MRNEEFLRDLIVFLKLMRNNGGVKRVEMVVCLQSFVSVFKTYYFVFFLRYVLLF